MTYFSSLPKLCARRTVTRSSELGESLPDIPLLDEFLEFFKTIHVICFLLLVKCYFVESFLQTVTDSLSDDKAMF